MGFLTGTIDAQTTFAPEDYRNHFPRFTPDARQANQNLVDAMRQIAYSTRATPAQVALAWLLAQRPWIVPIPGTTKQHRLEENTDAARLTLDPESLRAIDEVLKRFQVIGMA